MSILRGLESEDGDKRSLSMVPQKQVGNFMKKSKTGQEFADQGRGANTSRLSRSKAHSEIYMDGSSTVFQTEQLKKIRSENREIKQYAETLKQSLIIMNNEKIQLRKQISILNQQYNVIKEEPEPSFDSEDYEYKIAALKDTNICLLESLKTLQEEKRQMLDGKQVMELKNKMIIIKQENRQLKMENQQNETAQVVELKRKIRSLYEEVEIIKRSRSMQSSLVQDRIKSEVTKESHERLVKTNERLMQEVIRLNKRLGEESGIFN